MHDLAWVKITVSAKAAFGEALLSAGTKCGVQKEKGPELRPFFVVSLPDLADLWRKATKVARLGQQSFMHDFAKLDRVLLFIPLPNMRP